MSKWTIFNKKHAEPQISAGNAIAARIKTDLADFLTTTKTAENKGDNHHQALLAQAETSIKKLPQIYKDMNLSMPYDLKTLANKEAGANKLENRPQDLLSQATGTIGKLSRIFEQMNWPMPEYEEISAQIKQVGLSAYAKSLVDDILPTLIDAKNTKLTQTVIDAINSAGKGFNPPINDLYKEYCKRNSAEEIADQFAQAIIVGFTQKVLDAERAKSEILMCNEIERLTSEFNALSKNEDGENLAQLKKPMKQT